MSQRIECSRRGCRWTGTLLTASINKNGMLNSYVCPKCGCDSFYDLPDPIITERVSHANSLIKVISQHGRGFFERNGEIASFELDENGKVWFVDEYSKARIYTHYRGRWNRFSHGGTLRNLVEAMRDYIVKGVQIPACWIAPTRLNIDNGDMWGYGKEAAEAVRDEAFKLPIIEQESA